jgi:shikimate kinase
MDYVLIVGPPAVGKATVARELGRLTGYRIVLNTLTAEMLLEVFNRDEAPFGRLHIEFQDRILKEAARAGISIISTGAWAFNLAEDWAITRRRCASVRDAGGRVFIAELEAPFETRLERNQLPDRREAKPNQQATLSDDVMRELEGRYRLNSLPGEIEEFGPYVRIDAEQFPPEEAARLIVGTFGLSAAE